MTSPADSRARPATRITEAEWQQAVEAHRGRSPGAFTQIHGMLGDASGVMNHEKKSEEDGPQVILMQEMSIRADDPFPAQVRRRTRAFFHPVSKSTVCGSGFAAAAVRR